MCGRVGSCLISLCEKISERGWRDHGFRQIYCQLSTTPHDDFEWRSGIISSFELFSIILASSDSQAVVEVAGSLFQAEGFRNLITIWDQFDILNLPSTAIISRQLLLMLTHLEYRLSDCSY